MEGLLNYKPYIDQNLMIKAKVYMYWEDASHRNGTEEAKLCIQNKIDIGKIKTKKIGEHMCNI